MWGRHLHEQKFLKDGLGLHEDDVGLAVDAGPGDLLPAELGAQAGSDPARADGRQVANHPVLAVCKAENNILLKDRVHAKLAFGYLE